VISLFSTKYETKEIVAMLVSTEDKPHQPTGEVTVNVSLTESDDPPLEEALSMLNLTTEDKYLIKGRGIHKRSQKITEIVMRSQDGMKKTWSTKDYILRVTM
jgi:hypothetical protein